MLTHVWIGNRRVKLDPRRALGKGAEADVFDVGGLALKLFKAPDHPDLAGLPDEQDAARERLRVHQAKLPDLLAAAARWPAGIVTPRELAREQEHGAIVGYAMPLVAGRVALARYADPHYRAAGVANVEVGRVFLDLHAIVAAAHGAGVVIGDFNDLNVLVGPGEARVIDVDSVQFGPYDCAMFTPRFLDPLLCPPGATLVTLGRRYVPAADWYAFAALLMQSLVFVGPYGGIYRPHHATGRVAHDARPLRRITVFHADVQYPKPAAPLDALPDDLLDHFHRVFVKDERGEFPRRLLDGLRWTRCSACGVEHARGCCPRCHAGARVVRSVCVRGRVTATRVFATTGVVVWAGKQDGRLVFVAHEGGRFLREDGGEALRGDLDPRLRFRVCGASTIVGLGEEVVTLAPGAPPSGHVNARMTVDVHGGQPMVDANGDRRFWVTDGRLVKDGPHGWARVPPLGPVRIGDVLRGQTEFWVGDTLGFGWYRAGDLSTAFVFDPARGGLHDGVRLPAVRGKVTHATCTFARERAWFMVATEEAGRAVHRCWVIAADGRLEAEASATAGDGSWLGVLGGQCAAAGFLLAPTDAGVVRVEPRDGALVVAAEFPDTEPFVDAGTRLFLDPAGLDVVSTREVTRVVLA